MDWPIMVDSLDLLGVSAVPITLLIDEYGIIQALRPSDEDFNAFLSRDSGPAESAASEVPRINEMTLPGEREIQAALGSGDIAKIRAFAEGLFLWKRPDGISSAIDLYRKALELDPVEGPTHFRLGVALRARYESEFRQEGDFLQAVRHWNEALEIDPNQYIWRRRIQQYGPRLDKPYSFYDWVGRAREDIAARGEEPLPLRVEPAGAEFALPARDFQVSRGGVQEPDREARVSRDLEGMIQLETILVPATERGASFRVHMALYPAAGKKAHWNNEAGDMELWISPPDHWSVDRQHFVYPAPPDVVSSEVRRIEFELCGPEGFEGREGIPGYFLYYVCEDSDGTCLYRRQDFQVEVATR